MINSLLSLLPPFIVIILAATTQRMRFSLFIGIISAVALVSNFDITSMLTMLISRLWTATGLQSLASWSSFWAGWNLFILLFLLLLGIITTLIHVSGGAQAYAQFVSRYLKKKNDAESASLLLSCLFIIDDYFSCLTVGSVMQPVTDQFKTPRAKLAMLVNCMATSLVVLFPISSWAAEIIIQMTRSGLANTAQADVLVLCNPFSVFINTIPFTLYAFIIVISLWFFVRRGYVFSIIAEQENCAKKTGNLFGGKQPLEHHHHSAAQTNSPSMIDFMVPLVTLFVSVVICAFYFDSIAPALFVGACLTVILCSFFLPLRRRLAWESLPSLYIEGVMPILPSILMLVLIWTFSGLIKDELGTGQYIAQFLVDTVHISLLPALFFGIVAFTSTLIGSSWGAIGIYFPIGVPCLISLMRADAPITIEAVPLLYALFGAIISGAIVGNHLSPISDTLWMATTSAGAYHLDVIKMHYAFVMPCMIGAGLAFCCAGIMLTAGANIAGTMLLSLLLGCSISVGSLGLQDWMAERRKKGQS